MQQDDAGEGALSQHEATGGAVSQQVLGLAFAALGDGLAAWVRADEADGELDGDCAAAVGCCRVEVPFGGGGVGAQQVCAEGEVTRDSRC